VTDKGDKPQALGRPDYTKYLVKKKYFFHKTPNIYLLLWDEIPLFFRRERNTFRHTQNHQQKCGLQWEIYKVEREDGKEGMKMGKISGNRQDIFHE